MNASREVLVGGFFLAFFSLFAGFIAYLSKLILVNNLSVEEYGLFFSVFTFVLFFQVFISLGLPSGLSRTIAKYKIKNEFGKIKSIIIGSFLIQMSFALVLMLSFFLLSNYLAENYFKSQDARWLLIILSLYFPLNVLKSQITALFNGFGKQFYLSLSQFSYNLGVFLIILFGFYFYSGVLVPLIAYITAFFLLFLVLLPPFFKTYNIFKFSSLNFISTNRELIIFSLPLLVTIFGSVFISYFDTLMLTHYTGLAEVGVYNIVYPTALLLVLIGSSFGLALLPVITKLWEQGKVAYIRNAFSKIYTYALLLTIPLALVLSMLSEHIIRIFFGVDYIIGNLVFTILALGSVFMVLVSIHTQTLIGIGKPSYLFWVYLLGSLSNILLNLILIPLYSLTGAGIATILSFIIMFLVSYYLLQKEIKIRFPLISFLLIILSSLSIFFSLHFFWSFNYNKYILTFLGLGVGFSLYLCLVLLFRIFKIGEFLEMLGLDLNQILNKLKKKLIKN